MVAVSMREQDEIGFNIGHIDVFGPFIGCNKGIEKDVFATRFHSKAGMTVIRQLHNLFTLRLKRHKNTSSDGKIGEIEVNRRKRKTFFTCSLIS
jgi:hypothetical protein